MSSEAITQNDLREILSRTVGSIPSEYKKLLWTNPSPYSTFGTQTVISNTDLTIYDEIEIYYSANTGYPDCDHIVRQPIGTNSYIFGSSNWLTAKSVSITTNAIGFGDSIRYTYGGNGTTDNAQLIPQKIYGIKYERVAPPQVDASDYVIEQGVDGDWRYRKWESGMTEMWFYKFMSVTSVNTAIAVPSNLTINVSHIRTEQVSGTGDGFIGDIHHLWVRSTGTEVYVTPSTAGNYGVSLYIVFDE